MLKKNPLPRKHLRKRRHKARTGKAVKRNGEPPAGLKAINNHIPPPAENSSDAKVKPEEAATKIQSVFHGHTDRTAD